MPASYPSSVKTFTTKSDGAGNTILAAHINDIQLEVSAIETDLIAGLPVGRGGTGATAFAASRIPHMNAGNTALTSTSGFTFDGTTFTAPATTITQPLTISGASAGQIVFPASQNASTNANTLDDYEEGSFTPSIGGSGGQSGQAYTTQVGGYIKIGKLVYAHVVITLSTLGTVTGNAQIQGLPFTSENTANFTASMSAGTWTNMTSSLVHLTGTMPANGTVINLLGATAAATSLSNLAQADFANNSSITAAIMYRATA